MCFVGILANGHDMSMCQSQIGGGNVIFSFYFIFSLKTKITNFEFSLIGLLPALMILGTCL